MKSLKVICIFIVGTLLLHPCLVAAQDDGENKYGREMYTIPEEESPGTYNPWSSYQGLISKRMLKSIQKLNKKSLKKIELESQPKLEEVVELPELSKLFKKKITMKYSRSSENVLPEGVSMEELAEAIVKKLIELRKENKIPKVKKAKEETEKSAAVEAEGGAKAVKITNKSRKKTGAEEGAEEYKKKVKVQGAAITLTYLIFGKEVVIKAPQILADNFEKKENRLKKEIELMATLLNERGRK